MCTSHPAPRRRRCATPALVATALLLAASALPRVVAAQTDTVATDTTTPCRRCLNGHRFLVSSLVPDPFVTTHFRTGTGGGSARNLTVPVRDIEGNILDSLDATIGFVTLEFEYQYAVARWLGLRATTSTIARIGTNGESVLASGVSALSARRWARRRGCGGTTRRRSR